MPQLDQIIQVLENSWVAEGFLTAEHERQLLLNARRIIAEFYKRELNEAIETFTKMIEPVFLVLIFVINL